MPTRLSATYRSAFVTGASTGLGAAFADMLLAEGVRVWGTSRDPSRLTTMAARHPEAFVPVSFDLADGAAAEATFAAADDASGGFDVVINNAGYGVFAAFGEADFPVWEEQLRVMLVNTARVTHAAVRRMAPRAASSRRCALVNISSLSAEFPLPFQAAYNVCKAGLTALNESLMIEHAGTSLAIIDVRPGDYRTDFESSVRRPVMPLSERRQERAWAAFERMMSSGPAPEHAARALRRALLRGRSVTVRTGRPFQAVIAPFLARFGSLGLKRRVQASYFDLT